MMTAEIVQKWERWKQTDLEDEELLQELGELERDSLHKAEEITERFYKSLAFGTGGLRGLMGLGTNRMNCYTVGQAAQGYVQYLKRLSEEKPVSVAIAYDSRKKSKEFALVTARVLAAGGVQAYLFSRLAPTPLLSFAVRELGCAGGIVITASHNPAQYNGFKIYGSDGCQITGRDAREIAGEISKTDLFKDVELAAYEEAVKNGKIVLIEDFVQQQYQAAVLDQAMGGDVDKDLSIVYTPLNGAGLESVCAVLERYGFDKVTVVEEQRQPDGDFPTCPIPNPESAQAMELGIQYAERMDADLVLATDPDCDRVGMAVKAGNQYHLLSGNEIGLLLFEYICKRRSEKGSLASRSVAVKTIVTTDLIQEIGRFYGVEIRDVLTGFKYIGEVIGELENQGRTEDFVMGIEESHGYLTGTYVRDKDGVNASLLLCEMAGYYKRLGQSVWQALEAIYQKFGYCVNSQYSWQFAGESGSSRMNGLMEQMRRDFGRLVSQLPSEVFQNGHIKKIEDYQASVEYKIDGTQEKLALPVSNVIKIIWENGSAVTVRPSGTEPKLKIYIYAEGASQESAADTERKLAKEMNLLVEAWKPEGSKFF